MDIVVKKNKCDQTISKIVILNFVHHRCVFVLQSHFIKTYYLIENS